MEITVKNEKIKLKQDYLTNGEVNYMLGEVLKIYNQEGDIDGYSYTCLGIYYRKLYKPRCFGACDVSCIYSRWYRLGYH